MALLIFAYDYRNYIIIIEDIELIESGSIIHPWETTSIIFSVHNWISNPNKVFQLPQTANNSYFITILYSPISHNSSLIAISDRSQKAAPLKIRLVQIDITQTFKRCTQRHWNASLNCESCWELGISISRNEVWNLNALLNNHWNWKRSHKDSLNFFFIWKLCKSYIRSFRVIDHVKFLGWTLHFVPKWDYRVFTTARQESCKCKNPRKHFSALITCISCLVILQQFTMNLRFYSWLLTCFPFQSFISFAGIFFTGQYFPFRAKPLWVLIHYFLHTFYYEDFLFQSTLPRNKVY